MSDTPRTDAVCRTVDHTTIMGGKIYQATIETVDASFARQLERELAEARAEVEHWKGECSGCSFAHNNPADGQMRWEAKL